jgi:hypothetical protein
MFPANQCFVACGNIRNAKMSFDTSTGKTEVERRSNFVNLRAVYLWCLRCVTNSNCKNALKRETLSAGCELHFLVR